MGDQIRRLQINPLDVYYLTCHWHVVKKYLTSSWNVRSNYAQIWILGIAAVNIFHFEVAIQGSSLSYTCTISSNEMLKWN